MKGGIDLQYDKQTHNCNEGILKHLLIMFFKTLTKEQQERLVASMEKRIGTEPKE